MTFKEYGKKIMEILIVSRAETANWNGFIVV